MAAKMSLKTGLSLAIEAMVKAMKPRDRTNAGPYLFEIWIWQELSTFADDKLKLAWKKAQDAEIVEDDDTLRKSLGETIVVESDKFSVVTTVAEPAQRFDKDLFIANVAKKYKLRVGDLEAMADSKDAKKESKAALQKRVLEA